MDSLPSLRLSVGLVFFSLLAIKIIRTLHTAFFSPLSHVPGPLLCKLTGGVDTYQAILRGRRGEWMHELHQEYGPIVRVSPNLCSISDPEALKVVYGGKFPKSLDRYQGKALDGTEHMLIMRDPADVKARRGILLPLFQRNNLDGFHDDMARYTGQLLDQMVKEQKEVGSANVFRWFRLMAFDVIGMVAYGTDMKMTAAGEHNLLVELMSQVFFSFVCKDFIPFLRTIQDMNLIPPLTKLRNAEIRFVQYGEEILNGMIKTGEIEERTGKTNLLNSLYAESKTNPAVTRRHVATEAGTILVAGSDTTSTAMTYACYELSKRPQLQQQIRDEMISITEGVTDYPSFKALESLPLLNAFIKETLRIWPTLPGPLERSVPEGGKVICDKYLPEGTEVTMQAYSIHRNEVIFPEPLAFKPERWLQETAEMKAAFVPFSYGARNCVGMNLAWYEMRLVIGVLLRRFEILSDPQTNDETMAPVEHFFVVPKALKCHLRLKPILA